MKKLLLLISLVLVQICFGQIDAIKELEKEIGLARKESIETVAAYATSSIVLKEKTRFGKPIVNTGDFYRGKPLPTLLFSGYSREIDSSMQDSLNIIFEMMSENSSMIVQVVGLFQHEKNFSPFQKRAVAVKNRLVEMGIVDDRLKTMVKQYTELNDPTVTRDKANVIFEIVSFDYLPPLTPP